MFCNQQMQDAVTSLLLEWLNKAERLDDEEIKGISRELCYYWVRFNELLIKNRILELLNNSTDGASTIYRANVFKHP